MDTVKKAKELIDEVFGDTSVSPEETAERLKDIREQSDLNLGTLREDGVDC